MFFGNSFNFGLGFGLGLELGWKGCYEIVYVSVSRFINVNGKLCLFFKLIIFLVRNGLGKFW